MFMSPPKLLVQVGIIQPGVVWKIHKALYGLKISPILWETERDNT